MDYQDILYAQADHVATITINRPKVYNAFRPRTVVELLDAFLKAGWDNDVGAIVLTGAGDKAFCTGGDANESKNGGYHKDADHWHTRIHQMLRDIPKPVIAKVRGYAIGGGNVLATICDLTIAGEGAIFGPT